MSLIRGSQSGRALLAILLVALLALPAGASASGEGATWQSAPAKAPPPPEGAQPSPFPAELGKVGDIAFWSPNRGVLITVGNGLVPAGVYAYDGVSWHQLATVCGGHEGRIAWAGPDEFWTISDQRTGQIISNGEEGARLWDVSLCHFASGAVVGSYAMPLEEPDSYRPMDAAACASPEDCWFGGALGEGEDGGAFHLYWNGSTLSAIYSPQDHAVASMAVDQDQIYESVQLAPGDDYAGESPSTPPLLHTIVASDPGDPFHSLFPEDTQNPGCGAFCPPLPEYGNGNGGEAVAPDTLAGLQLSSDWSPAGEGPAQPQLWAIAGADATRPPAGEGAAHPIALRYANEEWTQVVPNLTSFQAGEEPTGVAALPGEAAAWVSIQSGDGAAHADLLSSSDGGSSWAIAERVELGPQQGLGPRGEAGPIACPAANDCWLATSEGWLFHLTDGTPEVPDTDRFFDGEDGVITYRPPDSGVPEVLPYQPPAGSQESDQAPEPAPLVQTVSNPKKGRAGGHKPLVERVHSRVLRGRSHLGSAKDVLELSFTLTAKAKVELVARRDGHVLAHTARAVLPSGQHTLSLALNPRRWPTKLDLQAKRAVS